MCLTPVPYQWQPQTVGAQGDHSDAAGVDRIGLGALTGGEHPCPDACASGAVRVPQPLGSAFVPVSSRVAVEIADVCGARRDADAIPPVP